MSNHVFISHSHEDKEIAEMILHELERRGVPCWIAPRDVPAGGSYAEALLDAIEASSCFVLIFTAHSNMSSHVLREVERALKFGINIIPVRFDDARVSRSLDYLLATVHWLSALSEPRRKAVTLAAQQIAAVTTSAGSIPRAPSAPPVSVAVPPSSPRAMRWGVSLGSAAVAGLLVFALMRLVPANQDVKTAPKIEMAQAPIPTPPAKPSAPETAPSSLSKPEPLSIAPPDAHKLVSSNSETPSNGAPASQERPASISTPASASNLNQTPVAATAPPAAPTPAAAPMPNAAPATPAIVSAPNIIQAPKVDPSSAKTADATTKPEPPIPVALPVLDDPPTGAPPSPPVRPSIPAYSKHEVSKATPVLSSRLKADPLVGSWDLADPMHMNLHVDYSSNHRAVGSWKVLGLKQEMEGQWTLISEVEDGRRYQVTWKNPTGIYVDTVMMDRDGRHYSGRNQLGWPISAKRTSK